MCPSLSAALQKPKTHNTGSTFESRYYPTKQAIDSFYICPRVPSGTPVGNPASLGKGLYFKNYGIGI